MYGHSQKLYHITISLKIRDYLNFLIYDKIIGWGQPIIMNALIPTIHGHLSKLDKVNTLLFFSAHLFHSYYILVLQVDIVIFKSNCSMELEIVIIDIGYFSLRIIHNLYNWNIPLLCVTRKIFVILVINEFILNR